MSITKALKRIENMSEAWREEGAKRSNGAQTRVTAYLASAIAGRCAEVIREECKIGRERLDTHKT
jgi:hypothetical protein